MFYKRRFFNFKKHSLFLIAVGLFLTPIFIQASPEFNLKLPYEGRWKVTSGYGPTNGSPWHKGKDYYALDFSLPGEEDFGKPILAIAEGIVSQIKTQKDEKGKIIGYGNYVTLDHGNGFQSRYAHLKSFSVSTGEKVFTGQEIGKCNNTGTSTGTHLHFVVYYNGQTYKPEPMSNYRNFEQGNWYASDNKAMASFSSTFFISHLGWLDAHKGINPKTSFMASGKNYDNGNKEGLFVATNSDNHIYYFRDWQDFWPKENGTILAQQHKTDPSFWLKSNRKIIALTSGNFKGDGKDILAVAFEGDDRIYFYHNYQEIGNLNAHQGKPQITHLTTGDIDKDGADELFVATAGDDHIYMFDKWNHLKASIGLAMDKITYLDAHDTNPKITNIETIDIDNNGYKELAVTTECDDHIYFYYYQKYAGKSEFGAENVKFHKEGFLDAHKNNPKITDITSGKIETNTDYLIVTTECDDHIYFYWETDYSQKKGGLIKYKAYKDAFDWGSPQISGLITGDFDNSGDYELAISTSGDDHINFYGIGDIGKNIGGDDEKDSPEIKTESYTAQFTNQSDNFIIMKPDETKEVWVEFENTGTATWKNIGDKFVALDVDNNNKESDFRDASWTKNYRPAIMDQEEILPGQIARFNFKLHAPEKSGLYQEKFRLATESLKWIENGKVILNILVDGNPPTQASSLGPDTEKSLWQENITNDPTPAFKWSSAQDDLSGLAGYFISIDNLLPNGQGKLDFTVSNINSWISPVNLSAGNHFVAITSRDKLGNINPNPVYYYFTIAASENINENPTLIDRISIIAEPINISADGLATADLTIFVYNTDGNLVPGKKVTVKIQNGGGTLSSFISGKGLAEVVADDQEDGTYKAIFTSSTTAGEALITAYNAEATSFKEDTIIIFQTPGLPAGTIGLFANPLVLDANGKDSTVITSAPIKDQHNNTVSTGTKITVATSLGSIITFDTDPLTPGKQIETDNNGQIYFVLQAGFSHGPAQITAQSVIGSASGNIDIIFNDVTAPNPPVINVPMDGFITNNNEPIISGIAEPNSEIKIYNKGMEISSINTDNIGNFSFTTNTLSDGLHTFQVQAIDAAGNRSEFSSAINIIIDTVKPNISNLQPVNGLTIYHIDETLFAQYIDNPNGVGIDISSAILSLDGEIKSAAKTASNISFYAADVSDGPHIITVSVKDNAGNLAQASWNFTVQTVSHFKSKVDPSYKIHGVANWPNANGPYPSFPPNWAEPGFNDNNWNNIVYESSSPPDSVTLPDSESIWLWGDTSIDSNETMLFRKYFSIPDVLGLTITEAAIRISADNEAWGFINGVYFGKVPESLSGQNPYVFGLNNLVNPGQNILAVQTSNNDDSKAGLAFTITVRYTDKP